MFALMLILIALGVILLLSAPLVGRAVVGREGDPTGVTRILQVVAALLLVAALLVRPHSDETAAFPPPPDTPIDSAR